MENAKAKKGPRILPRHRRCRERTWPAQPTSRSPSSMHALRLLPAAVGPAEPPAAAAERPVSCQKCRKIAFFEPSSAKSQLPDGRAARLGVARAAHGAASDP